MNAQVQSESGDARAALIMDVAQQLAARHKNDGGAFARALLARVSDSELAARSAAEWGALALQLFGFLRERRSGRAKVHVQRPDADAHSGEGLYTAISIATDDMPFLVDSVTMAVRAIGLDVHTLLHPVVGVKRDPGGNLLALDTAASSESLMYLEVDRLADASEMEILTQGIEAALADVRAAVKDWSAMRERMLAIAGDLSGSGLSAEMAAETQAFLRWVAGDHFTFLGYREYEVTAESGEDVLRPVSGTGLGILREGERAHGARSLKSLQASHLPQSGARDAVILTKTNARATVHRAGHMDYIGVLQFDAAGRAVRERRFLGLFTSAAYSARPQEIPLLRQRVQAVLERSQLRRDSHLGKALRHILETLPRDELFQASCEELETIAMGVLGLAERAGTRLFLRGDRYGRFHTALLYLPRERFSAGVRARVEDKLREIFQADRVDSQVLVDESPLARFYAVVRPRAGAAVQVDVTALEQAVVALSRNWHDDVREILIRRHGEEKGLRLANRIGRQLPGEYIEDAGAEIAASDVEHLAALHGPEDAAITLYRVPGAGTLRFKIIHYGAPIPLSDALPMLENLGVRVSAEHLLEVELGRTRVTIHDFDLAEPVGLKFPVEQVAEPFTAAFAAIWRGQAENDGFNRLVLGACMQWREVAVLRAYCKYLLQVGLPFSQPYMEEVLGRYPLIAGLLVELFLAKFDPARGTPTPAEAERLGQQLQALTDAALLQRQPDFGAMLVQALSLPRETQVTRIEAAIKAALDDVQSLDDDRILRLFLGVMRASLRTGYFQRDEQGQPHPYINVKLDSARVPELPKPKPFREIFVYSPRVEGIHLRFGPVARGGLRWSDRREDFRTEVLGLVKAQMVKNTVIVPVGSKGGFFVKRPPLGGDREAQLAEGIACYRLFIHALLDITDNIVAGAIVPPRDVVRHDADDPYLVVAADKGTATFSDIANSIAIEHDFWLGDAFASGGSHGYDHKGMAITARGGWESVKRHFRALGRDCQREDFTCVGIGDMSGDVFGNGMLLSRHTRLIAAFDHRDIFLDPNPDAERSFVERERMFKLPRSSWQDYDRKAISKGGGVWPRSSKAIPVSAEARAALGIADEVEQMAPNDLLRAILKAPVDLFWNGGIGTYVKASSETNADAGDRANNAIRLNGNELRCRIVGEGGNLGLTQRGRIEAAFHGVHLNTDFIDNSAGVDTSDHEVNIKILFADAMQRSELSFEARNKQLASMTDEIARLVLWDNYRQNQAISLMEHMAVRRIGSFGHLIRTLEAEGSLDRGIEFLPSDAELAERKTRGLGLTRPELSVLLSYDKIKIYQQLLDSDVPEDAYLSRELMRYFPEPLHQPYAQHMQRHRLKREIIATAVTNTLVNRMGASFALRMQEDTGQGPAAIAKAFTIAREVLEARELWAEIEALDGTVKDAVQIEAVLAVWELMRSLTRWLLNRPGSTLDIAAQVKRYGQGFAAVRAAIPAALPEPGRKAHAESVQRWQQAGLPAALAAQLAALPALGLALDVVEVAHDSGKPIAQVAHTFFDLGAALELDWMRVRIEELPVESRWHAQARGSLRDELAHQHRQLAVQVLASGQSVEAWLGREDAALRYTLGMLAEIRALPLDYPIASVAVRRLAQLVQAGA